MQLIQKHRVKALLRDGLEAGLASRQRDWRNELAMFGQGGGGLAGGYRWGGYGLAGVPGEASYGAIREGYIMRALGGQVGPAIPETFIIVGFDGSGGEGGVGVGVTGLRIDSLEALSSEGVDESQVTEVYRLSTRMPEWYGDGETDNQTAEDIAGAAGLLGCLRTGGVLWIGDNLQTVMDVVGVLQDKEMSAREAMRHRNRPALQIIRWIVDSS